jgi:hypothetical protein
MSGGLLAAEVTEDWRWYFTSSNQVINNYIDQSILGRYLDTQFVYLSRLIPVHVIMTLRKILTEVLTG